MLWKYIHHLVMEDQNDSGDVFPFYSQNLLQDHMERVHDLETQQLYLAMAPCPLLDTEEHPNQIPIPMVNTY